MTLSNASAKVWLPRHRWIPVVCWATTGVVLIEPGVILTPMMEKGAERRKVNPPDPSGPYFVHRRRLGMLFDARLRYPTLPEAVAKTIEYALITDPSKLRYVVGEDATGLIRGREHTTDEEWLENGNPMTDEEYAEMMLKRCGIDLFQ